MPRNRTADWIMLLALTVMWGSAFMLTKIAVAGLPATLVAGGRLAVACLVLLTAALLLSRRLPVQPRSWLFYVAIAFFGNALPFSLISWGQSYIESGVAGIFMAVMPLVTLVLAHYIVPGERMTLYRAAGFVLGFAGVVVLMGPDAWSGMSGGEGHLLPMLAVLGGAVSYAVAAILARLRPDNSALSTAAATTLIATLLMLPVVVQGVDPSTLLEPDPAELLAVLLLGLFSTAIAAVVYFRLVSRAGPAFVSQLNYLIPLWAVSVGVLVLDEVLEATYMYALVLILGGIFVTQIERRRTQPVQRQGNEASA